MDFGLEFNQCLLAIISVFHILLLVTKLFSNNWGPHLTYFVSVRKSILKKKQKNKRTLLECKADNTTSQTVVAPTVVATSRLLFVPLPIA